MTRVTVLRPTSNALVAPARTQHRWPVYLRSPASV